MSQLWCGARDASKQKREASMSLVFGECFGGRRWRSANERPTWNLSGVGREGGGQEWDGELGGQGPAACRTNERNAPKDVGGDGLSLRRLRRKRTRVGVVMAQGGNGKDGRELDGSRWAAEPELQTKEAVFDGDQCATRSVSSLIHAHQLCACLLFSSLVLTRPAIATLSCRYRQATQVAPCFQPCDAPVGCASSTYRACFSFDPCCAPRALCIRG